MQIKGQEKILNNIDNLFSSNNMPQAILLVGDIGSGRHSIANYVAKKYDLDIIDISQNISEALIWDIYLSANRYIYLLDFSTISIKNQNSLLKFIEEPPQNCFIIGICENKTQVISTIQNRCQIWVLQRYSKKQLQEFTSNEYLLSVCNTPGKIITFQELKDVDILYYQTLADTVINKIYTANVANILTIADKVTFKEGEGQNKLPVELFIRILKHEILEKIYTGNEELFSQYTLIENLYNDLFIPHINKKYLFENFLLRLKYSKI